MLTLKKTVPSFSVGNTSSCLAAGQVVADVLLEVENVFFGYDSTDLLRGVSLEVRRGEAVAVMGRSGAGKSTLLKICAGLLKPRSGVVKVLGREVGNRCFESVRPRIAYIPQTLGLVSGASALYNVLLGRASRRPLRFVAGLWSRRDVEEALEALRAVGLGDKAEMVVDKLSGGERQRVAIARALFQGASVIYADEPVSNLDINTATEVMKLLMEFRRRGAAVVAVLHDQDLAFEFFDRVYMLSGGVLKEL
jgi:phosphonate transport system ATP-binding protein